jgi:hypothetical protein
MLRVEMDLPDQKHIGSSWFACHHRKQSRAPSSVPVAIIAYCQFRCYKTNCKISRGLYNLYSNNNTIMCVFTWATKLLTTRPSSMHMRGPYVLKIRAILTWKQQEITKMNTYFHTDEMKSQPSKPTIWMANYLKVGTTVVVHGQRFSCTLALWHLLFRNNTHQ